MSTPDDDGPDVAALTRGLLREGVALAARMGLDDMHTTDRRALALLDELGSQGRASPSALADRLGLSRGSVTSVVDRLCAAGLVERRPVAHDGRRVELVLTERARHLGAEHMHAWVVRTDRAAAALSPAQARVVRDYLSAVLAPEP